MKLDILRMIGPREATLGFNFGRLNFNSLFVLVMMNIGNHWLDLTPKFVDARSYWIIATSHDGEERVRNLDFLYSINPNVDLRSDYGHAIPLAVRHWFPEHGIEILGEFSLVVK